MVANDETHNEAALGRHLAAALSAATAGVDAALHVVDPFAVVGVLGVGLSAFSADMLVVLRADLHKMRRSPADLGAGHHQLEMRGVRVLPAHFEAMAHGHRMPSNSKS